MKKYVLLVAVGVFGMALTGLAEESKNLVNNPGFEQKISEWGYKRGNIVLDNDVVHEGLASLKINEPEKKKYYYISSKPITVEAGKQYRLSCYIKINKPVEDGNFFIRVLQSGSGKVICWWPHGGEGKKLFATKEATNGWIKKETVLDGFLPRTTSIKIYISLEGRGVVNIDDISLEELKMSKTLVDNFSSDEWGLTLGREFAGAKGSKKLTKKQYKSLPSAMCLDYDFTEGGSYVGITKNGIKIPEKVKMISFQARTTSDNPVFVVLVDSSGQKHRSGNIFLRKKNQWQEMFFSFSKQFFPQHWGGSDVKTKGKITFPIKAIWISALVNNKKVKEEGRFGQKGKLFIDDLKFYTLEDDK